MLGEAYHPDSVNGIESRYYTRSPLNYIKQVESAMIIFQGGEDKIVPPALAHEMVNALAANNRPYEYIEYPDEAHGFRHAKNNIDAWTRELAFYRQALETSKSEEAL